MVTSTPDPTTSSISATSSTSTATTGSGTTTSTLTPPCPAPPSLSLSALLHPAALATAVFVPPSLAADIGEVTYNAEKGSKIFETLGAVLYVGLVVVFFARLFSKRAQFATNTRLASIRKGDFDPDDLEEKWWRKPRETPITPVEAIGSGFLGFGISVGLFIVSQLLDDTLAAWEVPTDNGPIVSILVAGKTIVQGGSYLLTFMFFANAAGTSLLGFKLLVDPAFAEEINADVNQQNREMLGQEDQPGEKVEQNKRDVAEMGERRTE